MRHWVTFRRTFGCLQNPVCLHQRRRSSEMPTEKEVRNAYASLGFATSAPFQEVKRRYVELAKQHHPDVNGGGEGTASTRMVSINDAYATLSRFYKGGGVLPNGSQSSSNNSSQAYYTAQDEPYQPWHEDLNPLIYEMMWEEMRRQNNSESFAQAAAVHEGRRHPNRQHHHHHRQQSSETTGNGQKRCHGENNRRHSKGGSSRKTTTWPDADLQAMVNMYQDGKSFEFIANALGKQMAEVVSEFNRWSEDKKRSTRPPQRKQRGYYYAESPDVDFVDFDELNNPLGYDFGDDGEYADSEDAFFDGDAMPFSGGHYMSGHRPRHGGGRGGGGGGGRGRYGSSHRHW